MKNTGALSQLLAFIKPFVERWISPRRNGKTLAFWLVIGFLGFQGIKITIGGFVYEVLLIGPNDVLAAVVVIVVSAFLILAEAIEGRSAVQIGRYVGAVVEAMEQDQSVNDAVLRVGGTPAIGDVIKDVLGARVKLVAEWSNRTLNEFIKSNKLVEQVSEQVSKQSSPKVTSVNVQQAVGEFTGLWVADEGFKSGFKSPEAVTAWIVKTAEEYADSGSDIGEE